MSVFVSDAEKEIFEEVVDEIVKADFCLPYQVGIVTLPILDWYTRLITPAMALSMQNITLKKAFYRVLQPSLGRERKHLSKPSHQS